MSGSGPSSSSRACQLTLHGSSPAMKSRTRSTRQLSTPEQHDRLAEPEEISPPSRRRFRQRRPLAPSQQQDRLSPSSRRRLRAARSLRFRLVSRTSRWISPINLPAYSFHLAKERRKSMSTSTVSMIDVRILTLQDSTTSSARTNTPTDREVTGGMRLRLPIPPFPFPLTLYLQGTPTTMGGR